MDIAIDFGGTTIKIGLVRDGEVKFKAMLPAFSERGLAARLPDVERAVGGLLAEAGLSARECRGVGLALPGIVDADNRKLLSIKDKYEDGIGFDFDAWTERTFALPLAVENDARAALLGEAAYGAARGAKDAVLVIFGTGIGTAVIMNGAVVRGRHYQAGILGGHITTDIHGERCMCGNAGCLEAHASHWALQRRAADMPGFADSEWGRRPETLGYEDVIRAQERGEEWAARLVDSLIGHWSAGIVNLIHAYDPEVVVLSGGLMKSADRVLPLLAGRVAAAWTPWGTPRLAVADDPESSVLLGLSHLLDAS